MTTITSKSIVYYRGISPYSFRSGEWAVVLDVLSVGRNNLPNRPCFKVQYADGKEDYCPISDYQNYELSSGELIRASYTKGL